MNGTTDEDKMMDESKDDNTLDILTDSLVQDRTEKEEASLTYKLQEWPPFAVTLMAALQHVLMTLSGSLSNSAVVSDALCIPFDSPLRSQLFCSTMFMVGLSTILQTALGIRLPVFQGPSPNFLLPLMALSTDPNWACVAKTPTGIHNATSASQLNTTEAMAAQEEPMEKIYDRLQQASGALMIASLAEICVGAFGILNLALRLIGPITIAVTITLIGIALIQVPIMYGNASFGVAFGCMAMVLVFSLYMRRLYIPIPRISKIRGEPRWRPFHVFQLLPILLSIILSWIIVILMTTFDVFSNDPNDVSFMARSDAKVKVIESSPWFQISYPWQFGRPKFNNVALILGFTLAAVASLIESVGDYHAASSACQVGTPPNHAICRGILMEGIGSFLSGAMGVAHATTSYSGNIAVLSLTKTASRVVMYTAGIILILTSMIGKAGALLSTIPNPILGGVMMVVIGTLMSLGLSNLRHVDMTSSRNTLVLGTPFMLAILVPEAFKLYPTFLSTGNEEVDKIMKVMLGSPMFLGAVVAIILDNTVPDPNRRKNRFKRDSRKRSDGPPRGLINNVDAFSWPVYPRLLKKMPLLRYLPFLPPVPKRLLTHLPVDRTMAEAQNLN